MTPRDIARSEMLETGAASGCQWAPPSVVSTKRCVSTLTSPVNAKPCNASAKRSRTKLVGGPTFPTGCHVEPPSLVSTMVPLRRSTQPCVGDTKLADTASDRPAAGVVVVVVVVEVATTPGFVDEVGAIV